MKIRLFLLLPILLFLIISCGENKKNDQVKNIQYDSTIAKLVKRVTSGPIHSDDKIIVQFNKNLLNKIENKKLTENVFTFIPAIEGKELWKNKSTLQFIPDKPLSFRTNYVATLNLKKLLKSQSENKNENLTFKFNVLGREIFSFKGKLNLKNKNNPNIVNYSGKVVFTEATNLDDLKKAISLKEGAKNYKLELFATHDHKTFSFISQDIVRDNSTKDFRLTIKKEPLDLSDDFIKEFQVTTLEDFKVVKVIKLEDDLKPKLRIEFSDELDYEQNLSGMVNVENLPDVKVQTIGNSIVLDGNFNFGESYTINIERGLRSKWGTKLEKKFSKTIKFNNKKPQIKFASDGIILPTDNQYKLQFYSINLKRVHIEVKHVYSNSLGEFTDAERLNSIADRKEAFRNRYINRVGVIVYNQTLEISGEKNKELLSELDLSNLVKNNKKGLYLIRLNFNPADMLANVDGNKFKYIEKEGQIYKPLIFSNIGLTCKYANSKYHIYATDIISGKPLSGVKITFQGSHNPSGITNSNGMVTLPKKQYWGYRYIIAEKNGQQSVIKINEMAWNISGFDVGGIKEDNSEIKTFIYTERGVYRPGDEINLSFIARYKTQDYPENHPVTLSLYNPQRKKVYEITNKHNKDGFYNFKIKTKQKDQTGNWRAEFHIGNRKFSHIIKIETVVPYRLKVKINPEHKTLLWNHKELKLNVDCKYLFGNPAPNLPLNVDLDIYRVNKKFGKYKNYIFSNPTFDFKRIKQNIFKGKLDKTGKKNIVWKLPAFHNLPSALNIKVTATVTEKGGRPDIEWINIPYEPYSHYVGIQPPKYSYVNTGSDVLIPVILVNTKGKPAAGRTVKYRIYRNSHYWWWWYGNNNKLKFKSDNYTVLVKEGEITSRRTSTNIHFVPIDKGSYLVEVIDESGTGHSSGIFLEAYPYGGSPKGNKNAGTLALKSNKAKYYVGENASITFPAPKKGSILFTVERSNKILKEKWYFPTGDDKMVINVPITKEMVPNAYVTVSIIQPHSQSMNDRPIRTFGILPITVIDKETKHFIDIQTDSQFRPKKDFVINLQTGDHKQTQFTIAVVDEGLLDITRFRTPDPWKYFFRKIRLAVSTFDLFNQIISSNKGDIFKTFSIGGDMDYRESQLQPEKSKKRFKPVSLFKGPIFTDKNGRASVKFKMPNYIGSVRIMVIGARKNSYAKAEKTVPVKSELMILPTLPRVIGPNEKFKIPVSVFAMKDKLGKVNVRISTEGPLNVVSSKNVNLNFSKATDKDCYFDISTKSAVGQAKVKIVATSGNYSSDYSVDLMVRPTSPRIYKTQYFKIEKGNKIKINIPGDGIKGTNRATLTISNFPSINFGNRMKWLIHYPYGCIEQTTSSVFPQLYIKKFIKYPEAFSEEIDNHINAGLQRLRRFQLFSGAFSYWPYGSKPSGWGTLYAGHFMVEAKKLGYNPTADLFSNWLNYNNSQAINHRGDLMTRAYRSYILALNGNAPLSELNALKESRLDTMNNTEKWLLAASYKLAGQQPEADNIISNLGTSTDKYTAFDKTYGSYLRDKAMILDAAVVLNKFDIADKLTKEISSVLTTDTWLSTQTIGYSLLSIGKYMNAVLGNKKQNIKGYYVDAKGNRKNFQSDKAFAINISKNFGKQIELNIDDATTTKNVYVTSAWNGVPIKSNVKDLSKNLKLSVSWLGEDGNKIDPTEIKQGAVFYGKFTVENISKLNYVSNVALVQVLPSGWEIVNTRLLNESLPDWTRKTPWNRQQYLDIRDDRIMWFVNLYRYWFNKKYYNKYYFIVKLTAVTVGEFDLPATLAEAMYNDNFKAYKAGKRVRVIKP